MLFIRGDLVYLLVVVDVFLGTLAFERFGRDVLQRPVQVIGDREKFLRQLLHGELLRVVELTGGAGAKVLHVGQESQHRGLIVSDFGLKRLHFLLEIGHGRVTGVGWGLCHAQCGIGGIRVGHALLGGGGGRVGVGVGGGGRVVAVRWIRVLRLFLVLVAGGEEGAEGGVGGGGDGGEGGVPGEERGGAVRGERRGWGVEGEWSWTGRGGRLGFRTHL